MLIKRFTLTVLFCNFLCMQVFLYRAVDLGLRLSAAFESASGIPFSDVNLRTHATRQPEWTAFSSLSEATTLSLEFATLAQASGAAHGLAEQRHRILSSLRAPCGVRDNYVPAGVDSIPLLSQASLLARNPSHRPLERRCPVQAASTLECATTRPSCRKVSFRSRVG